MSKKRQKTIDGSQTKSRKEEHVAIVLSEDVQHHTVTNGFDQLRLVHNAMPELSLEEIDTTTFMMGKLLSAPFLISSMTGGYEHATYINGELAAAAKEFGLAIGIGSARQVLEDHPHKESYTIVRAQHPDGVVFTNLGAAEAVKITAEKELEKISRIVDLVEADGLIIHLNPLQELLQPEGTTDFRGVCAAIEAIIQELRIPVIVKEVGAGISVNVAKRLLDIGVQMIDVAGAGGTSWAGVEILRHKKRDRIRFEPFRDWGIPTADALIQIGKLKEQQSFGLIASGGIRNGVDAAKAIALRADFVGIARPLLTALEKDGVRGLHRELETFILQLRYAMYLTGSKDIYALNMQMIEKL